MGANYSKLDDAISAAAYDDQELKDMLHDIIANDTESFESVINDDDFWDDMPIVLTRTSRRRSPNLWESGWGILILSQAIKNPDSWEAKVFRKRFRLPFPLFERFVAECKQANIFEEKNIGKIAVEFKVLIGLRILGRDNCADDISEFLNIGESTVYPIFKQFLSGCVKYLYPSYVYVPVDDDLDEVRRVYEKLGLPGCVGSMDCTHILWHRCPKIIRNNCTGNTLSLLMFVKCYSLYYMIYRKRKQTYISISSGRISYEKIHARI